MEEKRVESQDCAIDSHLFFLEAYYHPEEGVTLNDDQEYHWL